MSIEASVALSPLGQHGYAGSGAYFAERARRGAPMSELERIAKAPSFSQADPQEMAAVLANAVRENNQDLIALILDHWHGDEDPFFLVLSDAAANSMGSEAGMDFLMDRRLFLSLPDEMKEKIFFSALDCDDYSDIEKLKGIPAFATVLTKSLKALLIHLLQTKPPEALVPFLNADWSVPLSNEELAKVVGRASPAHLRALVEHSRSNAAPPSRRLLSLMIEQALRTGENEPMVRFLLSEHSTPAQIPDNERERLFLRACETCETYPSNWAIARALIQGVDPAFSISFIERCFQLTWQNNLPSAFIMLKRKFGLIRPGAIRKGFIDAGQKGHLETVRTLLVSPETASLITSAEVSAIFREGGPRNAVLIYLLKEKGECFSAPEANELFPLLLGTADEKVLTALGTSALLDKVEDNHFQAAFAPLIELGTPHSADDPPIQIPLLSSRASLLSSLSKREAFPRLFPPGSPALSAVFVSAAGLGFYKLATKIHRNWGGQLPDPVLQKGALQACFEGHFLLFDPSNARRKIPLPSPPSDNAKSALLSYLLGSDWRYRGFNERGFAERKHPRLKELLLLAAEEGNIKAMGALFALREEGWILPKSDREAAIAAARENGHLAVVQMFTFRSHRCVLQ